MATSTYRPESDAGSGSGSRTSSHTSSHTSSRTGSRTDSGFAQTKLGSHHLAYLRAVAEGLPQRQAAARYLGHDLRDGAVALRRAHQALVDRVRTLARRQGDSRWRLIGLAIKAHAPGNQQPPIDQWADQMGFDEFGQAELLALYQQAYPSDRKTVRNSRLRAQQLALLHKLAYAAVETALPQHRLDAWLPAHLSQSLMASGLLLVSDLQAKLRAGGRWWASIPKIGAGKAERLALHLALLIPGATGQPGKRPLAQRGSALAAALGDAQPAKALPGALSAPCPALPAPSGPASAPAHIERLGFDLTPGQLAARDLPADAQAVRAWVRARAGSPATAKSYRRELGRFLLFLDERQRTLSRCNTDDCLAYMGLLQNIPADWIGKRTAPFDHAAWAPFAGPLSHRSQRHAIVVVGSCFAWLVAARYLAGNPWILVNRRTGDDRRTDELASRAFAPELWALILARLQAMAATEPAAERMVFLLRFLEATGLRAAELLGGRLGDLSRMDGRWLLQVHGKGSQNRVIPLAGQALRALDRYLAARGLGIDAGDAQAGLPLLASLTKPDQALSYRPLYGSMKAWLNRAIAATDLPWRDKVEAARASPHWLRHTCGTRALERGVPLDVVGQLLGHADPRTTAKYTRAQIKRVSEEMEKAFG